VRSWTNDEAIERWAEFPRDVMDAMEPDGDFSKRHLLNPVLLRMLGDVRGQRILDVGCGHGYLSRMLAGRGAQVTGVEPAEALYGYAAEKETARPLGIQYVQADLCRLPGAGDPFDAVVASMVLLDIPDWAGAMKACADALAPGGLLVFSVIHPCFEQLGPSWREHGEYRVREYLAEYEIPGPYAVSFHRPLSAYLNELARLGCRLREVAEPALDPVTAATADPGAEAYVHLPNFLVVAATKAFLSCCSGVPGWASLVGLRPDGPQTEDGGTRERFPDARHPGSVAIPAVDGRQSPASPRARLRRQRGVGGGAGADSRRDRRGR